MKKMMQKITIPARISDSLIQNISSSRVVILSNVKFCHTISNLCKNHTLYLAIEAGGDKRDKGDGERR